MKGLLDFRVLGPFEVCRDGQPLSFRGGRERALLALLVLNANRIVPTERLVDDLWGEDTPDGALRTLRVYVSRVRMALDDAESILVTRPAGYALQVPPEAIDAVRFERLVEQGRSEAHRGDHAAAAATFRQALALWRGPALEEVASAASAQAEAVRLEEARLSALEERLDADLACGLHAEVAAELEALTLAHPFRERLWGHRMTALYRSGRQADALRAFQALRNTLADIGIDPSPELCRLEGAILRHDPSVEWRAEDAVPEASPFPTPLLRKERLPLVGRTGEMARLHTAWDEVAAGERRLLLVGGEPGIGKSRLMAEFGRWAHEQGAGVIFGRCDEGMAVPYQPFVEALGRYVREASEPVLGRMAGELVRLVPDIRERVEGLADPARSDPETERYRLFEAIGAWLAGLAGTQPVLVAIDDLHWATKPTLMLLSHLVRSSDAMSILIVATYRDSPLDVTPDLADTVAELIGQSGVARLRLGGLDETEVATLMEAQARHELDDDGRALARVIQRETAGNPFFVREVLRHLTEKGAVVQRDGRWMASQAVNDVDVPDSVREVVGRRLTRLPDKTDEVLALAAVVGEHFDLDVMASALGEPAESVIAALEPALAARLVDETAVGDYRFAHALVRATLEDALGPTRRAQLHLRVAEAIEATYDQSRAGRAVVFAAHYQQAGSLVSPERMVDAFIAAGHEAAAALAWEEVARHWRAALDLMERSGAGRHRRADLLARLADLLYVTGFDLPGAIGHAEEAITLFAEHGDHDRVAVLRSRLGGYLTSNPVYGAMDISRGLREFEAAEGVLAGRPDSLAYGYFQGTLAAAVGMWGARPLDALGRAPVAVEIARGHGHEALGVLGTMVNAFALFVTGSLEEGRTAIDEAWGTADRLDHRILGMRTVHIRGFFGTLVHDPLPVIAWNDRELAEPRLAHVPIQRQLLLGQLALAYTQVGRLADAERTLQEAGNVTVSFTSGPSLELWRGDWVAADVLLRQAVDRNHEMANHLDASLVGQWLAQACRLQGKLEAAAAALEEALALVAPGQVPVVEAGLRIDAAVLAAEQGRDHEARRHLERAREFVAGEAWCGVRGRLALAEAVVLDAAGDVDAAGTRCEDAIQVFRRYALPWEEAEALLVWARALGGSDPTAAVEKRATAAKIYGRCGAGDAWIARAM